MKKKDLRVLEQGGILGGIVSLLIFFILLWLSIYQKEQFSRFSSLGYLGLFISNFLASSTIFLPTPTIITNFLSGNILNPILVGVFSGAGSALGDFIAFLLGFGTRRVINRFLKKEVWLGRFELWFKKNAFLAVFILAFIPNPIFDGAGILAGALSVKPRDFLLATLLGRVLRNILLAFGGQKILS